MVPGAPDGCPSPVVSDQDAEEVALVEVLEVVRERPLPRTGASLAGLTGLGLLLALLGSAALRLRPRRDELG